MRRSVRLVSALGVLALSFLIPVAAAAQERVPVPPPPPPDDTPVAVPECPLCKDLATRLNDLLQQRRAARGTLDTVIKSRQAWENELWDRQRQLRHLQSQRPSGDPPTPDEVSVQDRVSFAERQIEENRENRAFWEKEILRLDAEITPLREELEKCSKACKPPTQTVGLFNRKTLLVAGGAVVGGVLVAGGGGDTPVVSSPPAAAPSPSANQPQAPQPPSQPPAPPPQPPAEPAPTVAGVYDAVQCAAIDDQSRHDLVIRLCSFADGAWDVLVSSITIRHAAPFVNIEGAGFDTTSGAFRGSTRGTVAGFPNVGIAFDGTANAQTGRVAFTYTMGTGGELPGGRSITYSITLQKRR